MAMVKSYFLCYRPPTLGLEPNSYLTLVRRASWERWLTRVVCEYIFWCHHPRSPFISSHILLFLPNHSFFLLRNYSKAPPSIHLSQQQLVFPFLLLPTQSQCTSSFRQPRHFSVSYLNHFDNVLAHPVTTLIWQKRRITSFLPYLFPLTAPITRQLTSVHTTQHICTAREPPRQYPRRPLQLLAQNLFSMIRSRTLHPTN
jgi:hypothetical protein